MQLILALTSITPLILKIVPKPTRSPKRMQRVIFFLLRRHVGHALSLTTKECGDKVVGISTCALHERQAALGVRGAARRWAGGELALEFFGGGGGDEEDEWGFRWGAGILEG